MSKLNFFLLALLLCGSVSAQVIIPSVTTFREAEQRTVPPAPGTKGKEADNGWREDKKDMPLPPEASIRRHVLPEALRTVANEQQSSPFTSIDFLGLDDNSTAIPPDVAGAVGPNHIITPLNDRYRIQNKSGGVLSTVNATAFWAPLPAPSTGHTDPHVRYDQYADRWILVAQSTPLTDNYLMIAVSQTNDPTGAWNRYNIRIDLQAPIDTAMDYPLIGFNQNWLVISMNMFNTAGSLNLGTRIYVFDKANLVAGGALDFTTNAQKIVSPNTEGFSMCPATVFESGPPTTTMYTIQNWNNGAGVIRLVSLTGSIPTVTWNTGAAVFPGSAVTWSGTPLFNDFAPQRSDLRRITNNDPRISSATVVNGTLWCTHSVFMPAGTSSRTAVQWWQLALPAGTVLQNAKIDDPSARIFRAFPSIAVNNNNDVIIGYSIFADSLYAGGAYSFRSGCTPANTLMKEVIYKSGDNRYFKNFTGPRNRWGDYSYSCVDPADQTLWTIQQYAGPRAGTGFADNDSRWGAWWGQVTPPANKAIFFSTGSQIITETSAGSGCPKTTDYNIVINARCAADGPATVTLTTGGTATNGTDYQLIPSSVVFANGETSKTVILRVIDDGIVESPETLSLGFSISGTGVVAGDDNQTQTILLNDNDAATTTGFNSSFPIGVNSINANATSPFQASFLRSKYQYIFYANELQRKGLKAGPINGLSLNVTVLGPGAPFTYNGFTISMGNTAVASFSGTPAFITGLTQVFSGNYTVSATGSQNFNFTTNFIWDGTSNVVVETCFDNTGGSVAGGNDQISGTTTPLGSGVGATAVSRNSTAGPTTAGCALTTADAGSSTTRPDMVFSQPVSPTTIAVVNGTTITLPFGPNADVYFYSTTGEILGRLTNNTAHDYGCTEINIDRQGASSVQFWNTNTANYLASKTFRVLPANNNPAGSYNITLYYTTAEVNGWQLATGQTWTGGSTKIVKVPNQVSDITPASSPAGIEVNLGSVASTFGSNYSITATFTTGFSGFGVGVPGGASLPVTLLSFDGRKNGEVVDLDWKTATELNNDRFEIETSKDGNSYYKIGTVPSKGNSTDQQSYAFTDNLPAQGVNYYRLRQVDIDSRAAYSRIIAISFDGKGKSVSVYPNPAKDRLTIGFSSPQEKITIRILSAEGKEIRKEAVATAQRSHDLTITGLPPGAYLLEVIQDKQKHTVKFVKE